MKLLLLTFFLLFGSLALGEDLIIGMPLTEEIIRKSFLTIKDLNEKNTSPRIECSDPDNQDTLDEVSVISLKTAQKLFKKLAADPNVPFKFPEDGCYARAHYMAQQLEKSKIISAKIFLHGEYLHVDAPTSPNKEVYWGYHVAPVVKVKVGKDIVPMVFDPSIFDGPVHVKEWEAIQTRPPGRFGSSYYTRRFQYAPPYELFSVPTVYDPRDNASMKSILENYKILEKRRLEKMKFGSGVEVPSAPEIPSFPSTYQAE